MDCKTCGDLKIKTLLFVCSDCGTPMGDVCAEALKKPPSEVIQQLAAVRAELAETRGGLDHLAEQFRIRGEILAAGIEQRNELQTVFDHQWAAEMRAIKQWQEAHPWNDHVWPDKTKMVVWLLERDDELRERVRLLTEAAETAKAHLWEHVKRNHDKHLDDVGCVGYDCPSITVLEEALAQPASPEPSEPSECVFGCDCAMPSNPQINCGCQCHGKLVGWSR